MTTFTTEDLEELKTPWFTNRQKPQREGFYEVMTAHWPWPSMCEWSEEYGWAIDVPEQVVQWRGLKEETKE